MLLAGGAVACGGDEEEAGSPTGAATEETQPAPSDTDEASGGETETVDMKDIKFVPDAVTVKTGTTIRWTNSDQVPHTVTKEDGPGAKFDSGNIDPGGDYEETFKQAGEVSYVCTIHPGQKGTVTVE